MIRLVAEDDFYRIHFMPRVERRVRRQMRDLNRMDLFEDICSEIYLKMIPRLRKLDPGNMEFQKVGILLYFEIRNTSCECLHLKSMAIFSDNEVSLESFETEDGNVQVRGEDGKFKDILTDPESLAPFDKYLARDKRKHFWTKLLPIMVGDGRADLLRRAYMDDQTTAEIARTLGKKPNWVLSQNFTTIDMIRMLTDSDDIIRQEILGCLN